MPRIPAGAKTTDLTPVVNQARQQGFIGRIAAGVRYAITGIEPNTWMSPLQPIAPQAQEAAGRLRDYSVGYNVQWVPRGEELTSFGQLRALADSCDLVRMAIETRKDQMASMQWTIGHEDPKKDVSKDAQVQAITALFKKPDGVHGWQTWLRMLLEEVMVIDAPAVYPRRANDGSLFGFELIDGATLKVLTDADGRTPQPPSVAYQQRLKGIPAVDYTADEIVYSPRNPRVHKFYGYSPVEQIILTVNIALRRAVSQLQYYSEGNIPAAFANLPLDWTPQQIEQFQGYWDTVVEGDQAMKRKVRFVPAGTVVKPVIEAPLKDEFDEWLARVVCYCFSLPPTAFIKQNNRATAGTQQDAAEAEGLAPVMVWVKELMDGLIAKYCGRTDLAFRWIEEESLDPKVQSEILSTYQKQGVYSINDIRSKLGEDPIDDPAGSEYLIITPTGAVTLDEVMNPTPPPAQTGEIGKPDAEGDDPNVPGDKPPKGGKGKPTPTPAEKHDHGNLAKSAGPLTPPMETLRDAFGAALDQVRQDAIASLHKLGKAADGQARDNNKTDDLWVAKFVDDLDLSGLSLAWDDYTDTLQLVAADGARQEVARIVVDDATVQPAATGAGFDILDHQDPNAIDWAKDHAAKMLSDNGDVGEIPDATRAMVRQTITRALDAHATNDELATALQDTYAFSADRAELIARTEVGNALGGGGFAGAKAVGMKAKRWLQTNDENECPRCEANAAQGWIPIDDAYVSGALFPLQHPRCQCDQAYRRKPAED
jgi:hypothetical protein